MVWRREGKGSEAFPNLPVGPGRVSYLGVRRAGVCLKGTEGTEAFQGSHSQPLQLWKPHEALLGSLLGTDHSCVCQL